MNFEKNTHFGAAVLCFRTSNRSSGFIKKTSLYSKFEFSFIVTLVYLLNNSSSQFLSSPIACASMGTNGASKNRETGCCCCCCCNQSSFPFLFCIFSYWQSAEAVFSSEELSCLPYKNQNKSKTLSSWEGKFKFALFWGFFIKQFFHCTGPPLQKQRSRNTPQRCCSFEFGLEIINQWNLVPTNILEPFFILIAVIFKKGLIIFHFSKNMFSFSKWVSEWASIFKMWFFFKMCFHFQNVKGFVSVFFPFSEKYNCKQKSVQSCQIALLMRLC